MATRLRPAGWIWPRHLDLRFLGTLAMVAFAGWLPRRTSGILLEFHDGPRPRHRLLSAWTAPASRNRGRSFLRTWRVQQLHRNRAEHRRPRACGCGILPSGCGGPAQPLQTTLTVTTGCRCGRTAGLDHLARVCSTAPACKEGPGTLTSSTVRGYLPCHTIRSPRLAADMTCAETGQGEKRQGKRRSNACTKNTEMSRLDFGAKGRRSSRVVRLTKQLFSLCISRRCPRHHHHHTTPHHTPPRTSSVDHSSHFRAPLPISSPSSGLQQPARLSAPAPATSRTTPARTQH